MFVLVGVAVFVPCLLFTAVDDGAVNLSKLNNNIAKEQNYGQLQFFEM